MAKKDTNHDYAIALYEVTKGLEGKQMSEVLSAFAEMLYKKGKLKRSDKILEAFEAYSKKQQGIIDIEITTARTIDTEAVNAIKKVFGEKVESVQKIDEKILGGVVVKTSEKIFDASLKTQLQRLKQQLS